MASKTTYTEAGVRSAYTKLRELTKDSAAPDAKRADVEKQVKIVYDQVWQQDEDALAPDGLERRAEMALNEGHVELFEKVCDWCKVSSVKSKEDMGAWYPCYECLRNVIQYRAGHSAKLGTRLANSKQYFKSIEKYLQWNMNSENTNNVGSMIKNIIITCETAPAAIGTGRGLYQVILDIYNNKKNEAVRVPALMLLSTLATEKEAKELLNDNALSLLVDLLGKSVRNELPKEGPLWTSRRRSLVIRTLEKMITSDDRVVATLLKLNLLPLLGNALDSPNATQAELRATLTCLWTLSNGADALQRISKNVELIKSIEQCSKSTDSEQAVPAKTIMESIQGAKREPSAVKETEAQVASARPPSAKAQASASKPSSAAKIVNAPTPAAHGSATAKSREKSTENETGGVREPRVGDKSTPVFISYQSAYTERVLKIKRALEARDIPCWMATENMVGNVQDAIGEALMVAPAIIICFSHSYRDSVYCKIEANTALRWKIPMVACCVEEGYEADYWLGVITSAAPGLDCSTDAKFAASFERLVKELCSAHRVIMLDSNVHSQLTAGNVEEQIIKKNAHGDLASKKKQSFADWDVNRAAEWLKSLSLYDAIPKENLELIDGAFLKELRTMKRDAPAEFGTSLKEVFQFSTAISIKFRAELDKLE